MRKSFVSFNIFSLSLLILLGSIIHHHFDHSTIAINAEISSELQDPSKEGEGSEQVSSLIHFHIAAHGGYEFALGRIHFLDHSSNEVLLISQLLSCNRIALPPPVLV